jgi:predicted enzyme related to lactoylglutathione lyase
MDRALAFYRDGLGFDESFSSLDWSELRFGDAILGLHGGGDGTARETGLSIQYEEVASAFQVAIAAGGEPVRPPERREGEPIILGTLMDTEGNVIMLTQYLGHD